MVCAKLSECVGYLMSRTSNVKVYLPLRLTFYLLAIISPYHLISRRGALSEILLCVSLPLVLAPACYAVVPGMWPFLQSLVSFLPQIFLFLLVGVSVIFKFSTWKRIFKWMAREVRTKTGACVAAGGMVLAGLAVYMVVTGGERVASLLAQNQPAAGSKLSPGEDSSEWTAFRGNVRRSGSVDGPAGPQEGQEIWSFRETLDRAGFASSPAVAGDRVYVGANNDALYCFNATTGDVVWKFEAFYEVFSSPVIHRDRVYFGEGLHYTEDATFYCVDADTGEEIWCFPTNSHVESSPFVVDGKVIFGAGDDGVYCLDAETGRKLWQYPSVHVDGSPAACDSKVYFGSGYGRSSVYCLNLDDGSEIWTVDTRCPAWGSPAVWDGKVYIGTGLGNFVVSSEEPAGSVICLDARTGESLWEFEVGDTVLGAIAIDDGRAYFGSRDSNLYCIDASSGEQIWKFSAGSAVVSSPAVAMGEVYFGSDNGMIYCLDGEDGVVKWEFDTSESGFFNVDSRIIGSPAISNSKLFVGSMNFFFYCIGEEGKN
jgi:outer membrane protein assembly factor BamB